MRLLCPGFPGHSKRQTAKQGGTMKSKLTAFLALLLAMIMLIGCVAPVEKQNKDDEDNEDPGIPVKVEPTVEPTLDPMADTREVQYVLTPYQQDPTWYEKNGVKWDLPTYTPKKLEARAKETIRRCLETDDVTDLIPLYSYENVMNLNYISLDDKHNGAYAHITYIIFDWTHPYVYVYKYRKQVMDLLDTMPDAAIVYDADTNTGYMMYDLDNGMRLYHMLKYMGESDIQSATMTQYLEIEVLGNPAMMAKKTSFAEFDGVLKDGATITELADVDPVFNAYIDYMRKGYFYSYLNTEYADEEGNIKEGAYERFIESNRDYDRPVSSVLILTDGVLKIYWDYDGNDYVVGRYEFREDFIMESFGIEVSYKIEDRYYVG